VAEAVDQDVGGPGDRMLSWAQVRAITGVSRTTAWRMRKFDAFPRPVARSPGRICWWESQIMAWGRTRGPGLIKPPKAPRLKGVPRRPRPAPMPAQVPEPRPDPAPEMRDAGRRRKPRKHTAAANQIDFGF
jgi:prophage regulatory protein